MGLHCKFIAGLHALDTCCQSSGGITYFLCRIFFGDRLFTPVLKDRSLVGQAGTCGPFEFQAACSFDGAPFTFGQDGNKVTFAQGLHKPCNFARIAVVNAFNDIGKTVPKNSSGTVITVLTNDTISAPPGQTVSITGVTNGAHGTVVISGGGTTVTYTPSFAYLGSDLFTYTVSSSGTPLLADTATVLLDVVQAGTVTRLSGTDRYKTSAAISAANFNPGVPVAYIATGLGFADAMSGAPVAGIKGGPILLVPGTSIPSAIAAELTRLKPANIVILGGTGVVSASVATQLLAYTSGP